jgi:four helix bundle protein
LPKEENYVLKPQIMRAVISIPSNLAEGAQRTNKEFVNFIRMARGSLEEVKSQLMIINEVYSLNTEKAINLCMEIGAMTYQLMVVIRNE